MKKFTQNFAQNFRWVIIWNPNTMFFFSLFYKMQAVLKICPFVCESPHGSWPQIAQREMDTQRTLLLVTAFTFQLTGLSVWLTPFKLRQALLRWKGNSSRLHLYGPWSFSLTLRLWSAVITHVCFFMSGPSHPVSTILNATRLIYRLRN